MSSAIPKWEPGTKWDPGKNLVIPGPVVLFPDTTAGPIRLLLRKGLLQGFDQGSAIVPQSDHVIRSMAPDGMPCLVPNMKRVEAMPVDRRGNADKMVYPGRRVLRIF